MLTSTGAHALACARQTHTSKIQDHTREYRYICATWSHLTTNRNEKLMETMKGMRVCEKTLATCAVLDDRNRVESPSFNIYAVFFVVLSLCLSPSPSLAGSLDRCLTQYFNLPNSFSCSRRQNEFNKKRNDPMQAHNGVRRSKCLWSLCR